MTDLGGRLRTIRQGRDLTQEELSSRVGLERSAVAKIESGGRTLTALELVRFAQALRVSIPDIMNHPIEIVRAARQDSSSPLAETGVHKFSAELEVDRFLRDAQQLRDLGYLHTKIDMHPAAEWESIDDARRLAQDARARLGVDLQPLPGMADICASFGLWIALSQEEVDGLSVSPDQGFGVAIVGESTDPGRRRATAAHELGHHLSGDKYSSDLTISTSQDDHEKLIDAFASEFLLPQNVLRMRLSDKKEERKREELISICYEYRVSWSLALWVARSTDLAEGIARSEDKPTRDEFRSIIGATPEEDLTHGMMPKIWVRDVTQARESHLITQQRALELLRTGTED